MSLVTTAEFDGEVTLRLQGDSRIANFLGQPLASGIPTAPLPVYSTYGSLVDLVDGDNVVKGMRTLDANKGVVASIYCGGVKIVTNARHVFFDRTFTVHDLGNGAVQLALDAGVEWSSSGTEASLALTGDARRFPNDQFAIGGQLSYVTIGRIAATFKVISGVTLFGRRGRLQRAPNIAAGLVEKRRFTVTSTLDVTILAGETLVKASCYGEGGDDDVVGADRAAGGAGGFTQFSHPVTAGNTFKVVANLFGGDAFSPSQAGGGVCGVWTGHGSVLSTDDGRMVGCAGGGGGGKVVSPGVLKRGGNGNAPSASRPNNEGEDADATHSGGGGGWRGGSVNPDGNGDGGTGYVNPAWVDSRDAKIVLQDGGALSGPVPNPGAGDPDFSTGYGGNGQPGLVVYTIYGP